jgi:hypothetical protein
LPSARQLAGDRRVTIAHYCSVMLRQGDRASCRLAGRTPCRNLERAQRWAMRAELSARENVTPSLEG